MNQQPAFPWLSRCAGFLLEEQLIERVVTPTISDALHERAAAPSERAWLWRSRAALACAIALALEESAKQRMAQIAWTPFLALGLAGLSGVAILRRSDAYRSSAISQGVYLTIGLVGALLIVATPKRLLRKLYGIVAVCTALALAACPWFGESMGGVRQWLCIGRFHGHTLNVHISTLFLPAYAAFVGHCVSQSRYLRVSLSTAVFLWLLALQPDWQAMVVYVSVLVAAVLVRHSKLLFGILGAAVVTGGLCSTLRTPEWSSWTLLGNASLVLAVSWSMLTGRTQHRVHSAPECAVATAMIALTAVRGWAGEMLPLVGFGASASIALFTLLAMQARSQLRA